MPIQTVESRRTAELAEASGPFEVTRAQAHRRRVRIAEASGNSAFVLLVETLWDLRMARLYRTLESKHEYPMMVADTIREHKAIATAIARHDARGARKAMHQHIDATVKRYSKDWNLEQGKGGSDIGPGAQVVPVDRRAQGSGHRYCVSIMTGAAKE